MSKLMPGRAAACVVSATPDWIIYSHAMQDLSCRWARYVVFRWRPYRAESTGSLPNSEVNHRRARSVLNWGTVREHLRVLPAFIWGQAEQRS